MATDTHGTAVATGDTTPGMAVVIGVVTTLLITQVGVIPDILDTTLLITRDTQVTDPHITVILPMEREVMRGIV